MKNILLALSVIVGLLSTSSLFAAEVRDLGAVMKEMSQDFKTIGRQAADPSVNKSSADLSHHLGTLILEAQKLVAPSIEKLPASQQDSARAQYGDMMNQLSAACTKMEAAFQSGDNIAAQAALAEMSDLKGRGHDQFKE